MSRTGRIVVATGAAVACLAAGVFAGRILHPDPAATTEDVDAPRLLGGNSSVERSAAPLLSPIATGLGEPELDALAAMATIDGQLTASTSIGTVLVAAGATAEDIPAVFDPADGLRTSSDPVADLCTTDDSDTVPVGCPEGRAATVVARQLPPQPALWLAEGARDACPGESDRRFTVYSATPLQSLTIAIRPYGTHEVWSTVEAVPTDAAVADAWQQRFANEPYSLADFGYLAHCGIPLSRETDTRYEVRLRGVDTFGRSVVDTATLAEAIEGRRPPTVADVNDDGTAQIRAWTTGEGSVVFAAFPVRDAREAVCPDGPIDTGRLDPDQVQVRDGAQPSPGGVYDAGYTREVIARVPLTSGTQVLLCARIFDRADAFTPLATDAFLLDGPLVQVPQILLHDVQFVEPFDLAAGDLEVQVGTATDGCGETWTNSAVVSAGRLSLRPAAEIVCDRVALSASDTDSAVVPIEVRRRDGAGWSTAISALSLPQRDCAHVRCQSAVYWEEYAVPMPVSEPAACDRPYWDTAACNPSGDGVLLINVRYETVGRGLHGAASFLGSTDQPASGPIGAAPTLQLLGGTPTASFWNSVPVQLSIIADLPVVLESLRLTATDASADTDPACTQFADVVVGGFPGSEFAPTVTICAGITYDVTATFTDTSGGRHVSELGSMAVHGVSNDLVAHVEFLGGAVPAFGWVQQFTLDADGTIPFQASWSATSLAGVTACRSLDTTTADFSLRDVALLGSTLEVTIRLVIPSAGDLDCPTNSDAAPGLLVLRGSFTLTELFSGQPLVLVTAPDAPLQMWVTIAGTWQLGGVELSED